MNISETSNILRMVSAVEGREVSGMEFHMWHAVLSDFKADDVQSALIAHYRTSTDRLMPAHIVQRIGKPTQPPTADQ